LAATNSGTPYSYGSCIQFRYADIRLRHLEIGGKRKIALSFNSFFGGVTVPASSDDFVPDETTTCITKVTAFFAFT
jgi:hypothetical protein